MTPGRQPDGTADATATTPSAATPAPVPLGRPLLSLRDVVKRRGGAPGFELAIGSIDLEAGRAVAFVGPSGCGKSTLIDLLAMTLRPDGAERFVLTPPDASANGHGEVDIAALWQRRRQDALGRLRARYFGYVVQTGGLLPFLRVGANIALPQRIIGTGEPARVRDLAGRLGIAEMLGRYPARLSVGQRQRVAIARALAHRPAIVLADEPTASLDPANAEAVMTLFMELIDQSAAALVLVTHDAAMAARFGIPTFAARLAVDGTVSRTSFTMVEPEPPAIATGGVPDAADATPVFAP